MSRWSPICSCSATSEPLLVPSHISAYLRGWPGGWGPPRQRPAQAWPTDTQPTGSATAQPLPRTRRLGGSPDPADGSRAAGREHQPLTLGPSLGHPQFGPPDRRRHHAVASRPHLRSASQTRAPRLRFVSLSSVGSGVPVTAAVTPRPRRPRFRQGTAGVGGTTPAGRRGSPGAADAGDRGSHRALRAPPRADRDGARSSRAPPGRSSRRRRPRLRRPGLLAGPREPRRPQPAARPTPAKSGLQVPEGSAPWPGRRLGEGALAGPWRGSR